MRALDFLPGPADFDRLPLDIQASLLDSLRSEWQIESLGMMINYKLNWTEWYSIREFVQNALDATESVILLYEDTLKISYIADNGSGIILRHMFLGEQKGETEKEIHCLRGRFGEGMKLSLLPLMREGSRIIIRTVGTDYHFAAVERQDPKGNFHQITMFSRPNTITQGTVVAIENINCLPYRNNFAPMIAEDSPEVVIVTVKGGPEEYDDCKVRQVFDLPGRVYVRDIYVNTYDAFFGYNFWFDDTRNVLSSDRNEIRDTNYNIRKEFCYLLKANCVPYLTRLFSQFYSTTSVVNPVTQRSFLKNETIEWAALHRYSNLDDIEANDAMAIFEIILNLVNKEFSWSRDSREQKMLEHHGIADLRDILPDLRDMLVQFSLVKDPKDLARAAELTTETVVITAEDFRVATVDEAEELTNALTAIQEQLLCFQAALGYHFNDLRNVNIRFYAGNFKGTEQKVYGYFDRRTRTVYIHTKNLNVMTSVLRVFIHELAHAYCEECVDISQEFEDALQDLSTYMIEFVAEGKCDIDALQSACSVINRYHQEFNQVIQEKVEAVGNPFGLVRPAQADTKDRDLLDRAFFQISKKAFAEIEDVVPILWGYSPSANRYNMEWNCRGRQLKDRSRMPTEQIMKEDLTILRKLGIDLPLLVDSFDETQWKSLLAEGPRELEPHLLVQGENWSDPDTCLSFVINHPSRWIKARNFKAYMDLINTFPDTSAMNYEEVDAARQGYYAGAFADPVRLQQLRTAAPTILALEHPAQKMVELDYYAYPLKERLIEWAGNLGWPEVTTQALTVFDPTNRRYAVYAAAKQPDISPIVRLVATETHPEVMQAALESINKLDRTLFYQLLDQNYSKLRRLTTGDDFHYEKENLTNFLDRVIHARETFNKYGHWPYSMRR